MTAAPADLIPAPPLPHPMLADILLGRPRFAAKALRLFGTMLKETSSIEALGFAHVMPVVPLLVAPRCTRRVVCTEIAAWRARRPYARTTGQPVSPV
jgi:hypothetical protein